MQDRRKENLVSTDNAIIMARLSLRKAAQAVSQGKRAPGLEQEAQSVRSSSFILPEDAGFQEKALDAAKVRRGDPHVAVRSHVLDLPRPPSLPPAPLAP